MMNTRASMKRKTFDKQSSITDYYSNDSSQKRPRSAPKYPLNCDMNPQRPSKNPAGKSCGSADRNVIVGCASAEAKVETAAEVTNQTPADDNLNDITEKDYDGKSSTASETTSNKVRIAAKRKEVQDTESMPSGTQGEESISNSSEASVTISNKIRIGSKRKEVEDLVAEDTQPGTSGVQNQESESDSAADFDSQSHEAEENSSGDNTDETEDNTMGCSFSLDDIDKDKLPYSRAPLRSRWSQKDTDDYRSGYPAKKDDLGQTKNLEFYQNVLESVPDGGLIEDIHQTWFGDHELLERHHGYIQWLFPIRESGMNWQAQELQSHEIKAIKEDKDALRRFRKSYEMMLDFYGIRLANPTTGFVERAENWQPRFKHLNHSHHNYLRITRILKCLGELDHEHYKAPLVKFFLTECLINYTLPNVTSSCVDYWIHTLRDEKERMDLAKWAHKHRKY